MNICVSQIAIGTWYGQAYKRDSQTTQEMGTLRKTITTVGYGDRYPVTMGGRITAMFIMFMGVGIIGALASILASLLVGGTSAPEEDEAPVTTQAPAVEQGIAAIKDELAALRQLLEKNSPRR